MQLESKLPRIGTTIFTRMSALAASENAINLSQGYPDFDAPAALIEALGRHAETGQVARPRGDDGHLLGALGDGGCAGDETGGADAGRTDAGRGRAGQKFTPFHEGFSRDGSR